MQAGESKRKRITPKAATRKQIYARADQLRIGKTKIKVEASAIRISRQVQKEEQSRKRVGVSRSVFLD